MKGEPASPESVIRVGVTAARKGAELVTAFERRGARVLHGPTLGGDRPVDDDTIAAAIDRLVELRPLWFAASTGMGMRLLAAAAERTGRRDALVRALQNATVVARGQKAAGGLKRLGVTPVWIAPDERDFQVEAWLAEHVRTGEVVAVQVHGAGGDPYGKLMETGAIVEKLAPYVSAPPDDPGPGTRLAEAAVAGELDVVTFMSPSAAHGLATLADAAGIGDRVREALNGPVAVAAVGPVTGDGARDAGYAVTIESDNRAGALVRAVMSWWADRG
ncbi:uroporphyrinogen-III synthase [Actinoallomurus sp. NBC_01490]|jgi:uroporphyrinogen-III synthase|uniref:uroporphyrinogen-III synthase n=1 Tax=Actinoallomurus sp. NBC_01490 TaxID=2903557 RepID=UPI002E2FCFE5|nr:uroporphyrinogen-III synthase [Actinoallomurus sp. NBC_01490]